MTQPPGSQLKAITGNAEQWGISNLSVTGTIKNCGLERPLYILMTPYWSLFSVFYLVFKIQLLKCQPVSELQEAFPSIDNMAMVSTQILVGIRSGIFATRLYRSDWKRSSSTKFSPFAATNQANPIDICDLRLILSKQNAPWCHQGFLRILNPLNWLMHGMADGQKGHLHSADLHLNGCQ